MLGFVKKFVNFSMIVMFVPIGVFAAQQLNPRSSAGGVRNNSVVVSDSEKVSKRSNVVSRSAASGGRASRNAATATRSAQTSVKTGAQRSAVTTPGTRSVRSPTTKPVASTKSQTTARSAARQRATAVFNDVSKIGTGYTSCHEAYATCMDQFCANANDTYRRCFCSDKFTGFRDTVDSLDQALSMLAEFQDNNLNAVDKTAAEVNAMYTAAEGEAAIKRDTSASQKLLDKISNLLSGKKDYSRKNNTNSLGVLDFSSLSADVSFDSGDIFNSDGFSLFGDTSGNVSEMEGKELYTNANKQCVEITRDLCPNDSMFKLARSAYSILITQDCNVFEKNINAKKESVKETVRTAERYLRDARLEEYRAHNSADVNACMAKVEAAIKESTACGSDYEKCMDYTGRYINSVTGDPIYSQALFGLNNLIVLNGSVDVLSANKEFNKFLDDKRKFAATALDTCRDIADTVWYEFKRAALIQIAQAQDAKIQAVKDSCVATIRECYDKQSGELNELDTTDFAATGAISAVAARGVCYERVMACAALYGDPDGCAYDDRSKKLTKVQGKTCGLQALLNFVDAVDAVKVAEGCQVSLEKYAHELCDPKTTLDDEETTDVYPMGCIDTPRAQLRAAMEERARLFCAQDLVANDKSNTIGDSSGTFNLDIVNRVIKDLFDELDLAFSAGCEYMGGTWLESGAVIKPDVSDLNQAFYQKYYGAVAKSATDAYNLVKKVHGSDTDAGWCIKDSMVKTECEAQGQTYDGYLNDCILSADWYSNKCRALGGTYTNSQCEIQNITSIEDLFNQLGIQ